MAVVNMDVAKFSDTEIAQMFSDYVGRMQDMERHTEAACKEADAFDVCCTSEFPQNIRLQNLMYEKMMNTAVEYEESGFIAGFKTAIALLSGQEAFLPQPTQISTPKEEKRVQEAITEPKGEINDSQDENKVYKAPKDFRVNPPANANFVDDNEHINTIQIAEMFATTNFKVVRRIEKQILPYCDDSIKKHFIKVEGFNIQHKKCTFYRLDSVACRLYMEEVEPKRSTFVNIAGGCAKLQELMQKMFPAEQIPLPV